jgi:predicted chitinase
MATYINTLNSTQLDNLHLIVNELKNLGITNENDIAGILAVVSKETNFNPVRESLNYSSEKDTKRVRAIFGDRLDKYSDSYLFKVIKSTNTLDGQKAFGEMIYNYTGNDLGNNQFGDGYKFRGGGFNQITGRYKYKKYGDLMGVDLINNPDLINDPVNAIKIMKYFFDVSNSAYPNIATQYNGKTNEFDDINDATGYYYHHNAGGGKSMKTIIADTTGGRKKAFSRNEELLDYITEKNLVNSKDTRQKKNTIIYITLATIIGYFIYKNYTRLK